MQQLVIPDDPTSADIKNLQSRIDAKYGNVRVNYAILKGEKARLKHMFSMAKKQLYLTYKNQASTEREREALVIDHIEKKGLPGFPNAIEEIGILEEQTAFLKAVLETLEQKAQRLITCLGSLKIEAQLLTSDSIPLPSTNNARSAV
jgi:hypothetical protein